MANFYLKKRKRAICALSLVLTASFSLSLFAACNESTTTDTDDDDTAATAPTDTQLLKNGNFEFYTEQVEKLEDKRAFIASPTSWSFTSGSPASDTKSGIVETDEWNYVAKQGRKFTSVADAYAHWEDDNVTLYDRLQFFDLVTKKADSDTEGFKEEYDALSSSSAQKKLFAEYSYSIDFEDVEDLNADFPNGLTPHIREEGDEEDGTAMLMIHNDRDSDGVLGSAQYYTSSTTITLEAGTAAEITGWVMTDHLFHYYSSDNVAVEDRAGAYIGVINTVGGTTLDEMQIKNINTKGEWKQYTLYVRASTYATTTFRLKLGLGQGTSSDNRYENVNGYAFFDDFSVKKIPASEYNTKTEGVTASCDINSVKEDKLFDVSDAFKDADVFALDLYADESYESLTPVMGDNVTVGLTEEISGSNVYKSKVKDNSNDSGTPENERSIVGVTTYTDLKDRAASNGYLKNIFKDDFETKFPFYQADGTTNGSLPILMMLSTNGAAYTAKMTSTEFKVENSPLLISFFVKTSDIRAGKTGAGITLIDEAGTRTSISPFNSTTVATVDIDSDDEALTDIYKGWVQCFFFVQNDTFDSADPNTAKTFRLEFTFGPTDVATADVSDYAQGYAAFTDFKFTELTDTQYSYASTGDRAKKVTLTSSVSNSTKFDDYQASSDIEHGLATPSSFTGKLAGSKVFVNDETARENALPEHVYAGLLNYDYRDTYFGLGTAWSEKLRTISTGSTADEWWKGLFGDVNNSAIGSQQPLVFLNTSETTVPAYGFVAASATLSANSTRRIGLRVKLGENTKVNVYLVDTTKASSDSLLAPHMPKVTYWYDKDGNIVKGDPEAKDFDAKTDVLFYREENGLYRNAVDTSDTKLYANLSNYDTDSNGNYVTREETPVVVFYKDGENFYAYREETSTGSYTYDTPVTNLPTELTIGGETVKIARYVLPAETEKYEAKISLTGTAANTGSWTDVSFYLRTGSEEKNYRVEIWIGERYTGGTADTIPAGAYAFFDSYTSSASVSDYDAQQKEVADFLLETQANRDTDDEEKLNSDHALYYTYTLYDAADFIRYDGTTDEGGVNWWGSYDQSGYTERVIWLRADDEHGAIAGGKLCSLWLDYSAVDNTVTRDQADTDTDTSTDTDTDTASGDVNPWLIVSSALLGAVTLFAVAALLVRFLGKKFKKNKVKPVKAKKQRAPKAKKPQSDAPAEPAAKPSKPDGNPYDE